MFKRYLACKGSYLLTVKKKNEKFGFKLNNVIPHHTYIRTYILYNYKYLHQYILRKYLKILFCGYSALSTFAYIFTIFAYSYFNTYVVVIYHSVISSCAYVFVHSVLIFTLLEFIQLN